MSVGDAQSPGESFDAGCEWLRTDGPECDVVMSSRVRLARNFAGYPFLSKASVEERRQIVDIARRQTLDAELAPQVIWVDLTETPTLERNLLVERHLISKQHARGDEPRAVAVSNPDERLAIMVNEEDHLRIQVMRTGLAIKDAFSQIDSVDDAIESRVEYAFCPRFGYLTACPTNVGTGVRVSTMLHLPGLKISGEIDKVRKAASGMSLAVRGFYGEGSDAIGDFYQISNQTTLGKSEEQIIEEFETKLLPTVISYERHARRQLLSKRRVLVEDRVHRALGALRSARLLAANEALQLLALVRFGVTTGLLDHVELAVVNRLILLTQPAHLQRTLRKTLDQAQRRIARAELVRAQLSGDA